MALHKDTITRCLVIGTVLFFALFVTGCDTLRQTWTQPLVTNQSLVNDLNTDEKQAASEAIADALSGVGFMPVRWGDLEAGRQGLVVPGSATLTGLTSDGSFYATPIGLETSVPLVRVNGEYRVQRASNVRQAPAKSAARLQRLKRGTRINVLARDTLGGWHLIEREGIVLGYISGGLIAPVEETESLSVQQERVAPVYCRVYTHLIESDDGLAEEWTGTACLERVDRWVPSRVVTQRTRTEVASELIEGETSPSDNTPPNNTSGAELQSGPIPKPSN